MKITKIHKFGEMTFSADGGCHIEGWALDTDDKSRTPDADELAIMLFEFLAERTRQHVLARSLVSTAVH